MQVNNYSDIMVVILRVFGHNDILFGNLYKSNFLVDVFFLKLIDLFSFQYVLD